MHVLCVFFMGTWLNISAPVCKCTNMRWLHISNSSCVVVLWTKGNFPLNPEVKERWGDLSLSLSLQPVSFFLCPSHIVSEAVQHHPAVKPFGGKEEEWASWRSVWSTDRQTDIHTVHTEDHASISRACVYHGGIRQGFGGICCSPWQPRDRALTIETTG